MALAELPCKCIINDGISQAEQESGVSHIAGIGKTPNPCGLWSGSAEIEERFPTDVGVPVPPLWLSKTVSSL